MRDVTAWQQLVCLQVGIEQEGGQVLSSVRIPAPARQRGSVSLWTILVVWG